MKDWKVLAKEEGRICPECSRPITVGGWKAMQRKDGTVRSCWTCQYVHWNIPLRSTGGSVLHDNQDREGWNRIRANG